MDQDPGTRKQAMNSIELTTEIMNCLVILLDAQAPDSEREHARRLFHKLMRKMERQIE